MTAPQVVLLTIPGLRRQDLATMPNLNAIASSGSIVRLEHHFPAVTWTSQANMLTGCRVNDHGVTANGFYWRDRDEVEMWTAWNEVITQPQIWDRLKEINPEIITAAWFPMLSKGCGADHVCMPAPIHRPDGSEDLWCYTKPQEFYGELLERLEHFPLQHFWGPLANIKSTQWIVDSAVAAAGKFAPHFFYIYLPHLDYAAQKFGPDSEQARSATVELDNVIGGLRSEFESVYSAPIQWFALSEYTIQSVDHVSFPNRKLRDDGFLVTKPDADGKELIDRQQSIAWALVDHQFSHVYVRETSRIEAVKVALESLDGIDCVLDPVEQQKAGLAHERSGELVAVSAAGSWQAYYWWNDDELAPGFARTVDIHQKPGYDPVELCFDMSTRSVPLDATLIRGSHGRGRLTNGETTWVDDPGQGILVSSGPLKMDHLLDVDVCKLVLDQFQGG